MTVDIGANNAVLDSACAVDLISVGRLLYKVGNMVTQIDAVEQKGIVNQDDLIDLLEKDIYLGKLAPGMWLKQIDLEKRYGCTRLALRHALEHLASRKMVEKVLNRGFYVPTFELELVKQIADARARIEMSIAEEIAASTTDRSLQKMKEFADEFADKVRTGTIEEQDRANFAFHEEMLKASPCEILTDIIWSLRLRIPLMVQRQFNTPVRLEANAKEHFDMVEAIRTRDPEWLKQAISDHIYGQYKENQSSGER